MTTGSLVRVDSVLEGIADSLEFCVFGDEVAIADDRAELVFGNGFGDFAPHAKVEGGPDQNRSSWRVAHWEVESCVAIDSGAL